MKKINIIGSSTSGLGIDIKTISQILDQNGFKTTKCKPRSFSLKKLIAQKTPTLLRGIVPGSLADANIFLESIPFKWLPAGKVNILIPNQEWCRPSTVKELKNIDHIICKTRYAESIFKKMGYTTHYTGFSGQDMFNNEIKKDYKKFVHIAGQSEQKGTNTICKIWERHPEWPCLNLITHRKDFIERYREKKNIIVKSKLPLNELISIQNECGIHLCVSEAEGFGHYISEALSCGAVVVTTHAPPMNELVNQEAGYLVDYHKTENQNLGTNFFVDEMKLEETISRIIETKESALAQKSEKARLSYLKQKDFFEKNFAPTLQKILAY